ncbi:B3 domain-containing protein [Capsicum baccatum]|uniref:B3 domain-containing protein n=1 Tax=Capsicum baccatum TaxID=33114 RepID=A0A2G2W9Y8_CAPBA|nr:B3 domain-containing protein [Capsicum baccatum]
MAISAMYSKKNSPLSASKKKALEIKKRALGPRTNKVQNRDKKKGQISNGRKGQKYGSVEANSLAMLRAKEFQANLPSEFPSFIKYMLNSHVARGFWLSFPKKFCDSHLPKHDDTVILVDEKNEEFGTNYLVDKNGLSGGWKGFSIAHNLLEKDVLVFQLIEPCKFKVYIVRENYLREIDAAAAISPPEFHADRQEEAMLLPSSEHGLATDQCGNNSDNGCEVLERIRLSKSRVEFKDIKDFSGFHIVVDGLIIDSQVPAHFRAKYYVLCCTQNSYLHDHLLGDPNVKLVAGMITETVSIADGIKASSISTPSYYFEIWDRSLKAFEYLGLRVGFLRERLSKLINLSCELENILAPKKLELAEAKEEMLKLEEKVLKAKHVIKNLDSEVKALTRKDSKFELDFKALATTPW